VRPVRGLALLSVAVLTIWTAPGAIACGCASILSVREALAHAEWVFVGTALSVDPSYPIREGDPPKTTRVVTRTRFRVGHRWKGPLTRTLNVYSFSNCSYRFQAGRIYLVFAGSAVDGPQYLEASVCLPNQPFREGASDLQALGEPLQSNRP
jgi:hypothetical protein